MNSIPDPRRPARAVRLAAGVLLALTLAGYAAAAARPLPADPGAAGRETLAGIDSDGDGLRDDIQRWIALSYPDSARWRAALGQTARTLQRALAQEDDAAAAWADFAASARDFSCIVHVAWRTDETWGGVKRPGMAVLDRAMDADSRLRAEILDTDIRRQAWRRLQGRVPGGVLDRPDIADRAQTCDFDPEALPD